ncbi:hypothetical protein [Alkalibacterium putridalgicola]|uniref:Peptidoglycan binding domain-containing protein n=1 Tax=Alkalibacterium putridalgicola TaxID=426703 RepID=A0ABQ0V161_9LACT|nr:hypothetical protein [Alkalibacterium putridalgicola]GEK89988.1 hypothetical protein APU01nite_20270 [Alkalibacterium putridalgicola]
MVVRALQGRVGVYEDGSLGPNTIKAFQRHLGTPVIGGVNRTGSAMVKALQNRLNENRF